MNRSGTSPFRASGITGPRPQGNPNSNQSLQLLIRSLERQNTSLVEEVNMLKQKGKRANQLQDKTDLIVKHNDQLLRENERLAKLINQKKNEVQTWKNKFESFSVNRSATSQLESRKLLNQIQMLKQEITNIQQVKNMQINELKNQNYQQIQNLKRHNLNTNQKYELEIRKYKEYCQKKQFETSQLNTKFVRVSKELDFQIAKLKQERQRLKGDLMYTQAQHKKQIDQLKSKFEYNFHSQIENLKKQHLNQIQVLDYQNCKLKQVINSKNSQIQHILSKNVKVKNNYEDSLDLLKKQNEDLKDKIFETQRIADIQLSNLRDKLEGIKQSQLTLLQNAHNNQLDLQQREIKRLQEIIENRNIELQNLSKQKNQIRLSLQAQIIKLHAQLEDRINQNRQQAIKFQNQLQICDLDLKSKNQQLKTIQTYLQSQVNTLKGQNSKLSELLDRKTESLDKQRQDHYKTKKNLEDQVRQTKNKLANTLDELERQSKKSNNEIDEVRKLNELKVKQLQAKIRGLSDENQQKDGLILQLRETIRLKQLEIKKSNEKIIHLQKTQKDLRRQAKQNLSRWQAKQSEYNILVKSQTDNMQKARKRQIEQLKNIQQNKLNSLRHQIKQYERHIEDKNKLINNIKSQYQDLVNKFQQIFSQRAAQKNLDIKIPGWIADTISTKNIFDVFLKNKILQYCS